MLDRNSVISLLTKEGFQATPDALELLLVENSLENVMKIINDIKNLCENPVIITSDVISVVKNRSSKQKDWNILCNFELSYIPSKRKIEKETDKVIKYENGEVYHKFNELNSLTSKSWLKFQKSWFILNPRPREEDVLLHPAKFPEELIQDFIEFFTKRGQTVLDPMVGTGSTLVACADGGRNGIGIELLEKYALITKKRLQKIISQTKLPVEHKEGHKIFLKVILGDARNIDKMDLPEIDYCITSPPYWEITFPLSPLAHHIRRIIIGQPRPRDFSISSSQSDT